MNVTKLTAAALAVLVVTTGVGAVAATPGNGDTPDDAGSNAATAPTADATENATEVTDDGMSRADVADRANASESANDSPAAASEGEVGSEAAAAADDGRRGPPADLPEQVPDHVSEVHQRIVAFLDGELDDLGAAVSDVTPDHGDDAESASGESEDSEPETGEPEAQNPETEADSEYTETATPTAEA